MIRVYTSEMIKRYIKGKVKYLTPKQSLSTSADTIKYKRKKNIALYVFPSVFFTLGVLIVLSQITPSIKFVLEKNFSPKYAEILSPVPEELLAEPQQEENVGGKFESQYFADLFSRLHMVNDNNVAGTTLPYKYDWEGTFTISIPAINIVDMPVTANVNSYDEDVYSSVLRKSLAHFQGTDLPAPKNYPYDSNTFIYGHSAPSDWALFHKNSFESALNPLFDINIGDKIIVKIDGEELVYSVAKVKITKPTDMSLLSGIEGEKTITLMTCAPPGSTTNRLNVIATLD